MARNAEGKSQWWGISQYDDFFNNEYSRDYFVFDNLIINAYYVWF
jgi:hypothetical protein